MPLSPQEWTLALAPEVHWQTAYATVAREVKAYLAGRSEACSTFVLAEALFPAMSTRDLAQLDARKRMFRALMAQATRDLKDYVSKGPQVRRRFGNVTPWSWHDKAPASNAGACPHCGGLL